MARMKHAKSIKYNLRIATTSDRCSNCKNSTKIRKCNSTRYMCEFLERWVACKRICDNYFRGRSNRTKTDPYPKKEDNKSYQSVTCILDYKTRETSVVSGKELFIRYIDRGKTILFFRKLKHKYSYIFSTKVKKLNEHFAVNKI